MRLIITRHGETKENKLGIIQGHLPGKLSDEGTNQAKKVALRLKNEKIDYIFSSDLARASDTAKEIAKFHPNAPIKFVKDLRERNLGEFEGKKKSDFGWDAKDFKATLLTPKKGETIEQLYARAELFFSKIMPKHHKDTVLLVGHNGINKALIAVITGKKHEDIRSIENQHNTSVNIFEIDEDKSHKIHAFNCIKHLSD
ncbi:MAG: histidine phosphatase family protein [Nanoarchaeota archaeon]|nr:histidine phosphatase family protein [Nanoarchaeota archaeon]